MTRWLVLGLVPAWCEVLHLQSSPPRDLEAAVANWNLALEDAGAPPFAGELRFRPEDPGGCRARPLEGALVLVDAAAVCEDLVQTTHRLAEAGASGVVFLHSSDGLAGISLGHAEPPPIRAVVVERASGLEAVLVSQVVRAELRQGKLISEEAYEEQFIFRVDEFHATRKENFLWHRYPGMLRSSGRETLSARLMRSLSAPAGWFSRAPAFVPLFNPSVLALQDGSFLVALRMSNGPGCPSVRVSRESSMDTRIFRNELVLAHLDSDFQVKAHVLVEMPPLSCRFAPGTQAGRQFLDEVHGPMDARIAWGEEEIWVFFYAERNRGTSTEVERGMHGAPLRLEWGPCQVWELYRRDKVFAPEQCAWLGSGDKESLGQCQRSCEAPCNAVNFREGVGCELRRCQEDASQVFHLAGWQSWRQKGPAEGCLRSARVKAEELLAFPAENVEKNWNLIQGQRNRLFLEYFVEPHVVLQAHLQRGDGGIALAGLEQTFVSRWPYEILHGVTNVRGGFCCLRLPLGAGAAGMAAAEPWWDRSQLELPDLPAGVMLGAGHLQRIRSPFDQAPGDVSRFRRQAKSRTYHQFFYLLRDVQPFDVVAVSPEWCITINGHFSQHWAKVLAPGEEACESIQFVAGLALRNWEVVVSYGINDCESDLLTLPLSEVLAMLRPVVSDVNVSLDDLEMI